MCPIDPFRMTDQLDDTLLQVIFTRLEARGKHSFFEKMLQEYLNAMDIDRAKTVLDIGCGTGVAARAIARRPGFGGQVTGVDLSPYLVKAATHLAGQEGVGDRTLFHKGDAHRLDFSGGTFDAVVLHTLLSHIEDPLLVVKEAARVVKPGGMVGIFDGDYASLTFGHADPSQGKSYDEALIKAIVTNPRVMRQMPRYLCAAGFELVVSFPYILAEIGKADFWLSAIEPYRRLISKAGTLTEVEANEWAESLLKDSEEEVFFGASNYFSYVARRG